MTTKSLISKIALLLIINSPSINKLLIINPAPNYKTWNNQQKDVQTHHALISFANYIKRRDQTSKFRRLIWIHYAKLVQNNLKKNHIVFIVSRFISIIQTMVNNGSCVKNVRDGYIHHVQILIVDKIQMLSLNASNAEKYKTNQVEEQM